MPKEQYMCQLCCNHNIFNQPKKGHKSKCPYRNCGCNACGLNTKRRALDQIERKLRVKKSPSPQPSSPNSHLNYPPQQFQMSQNLVSPTNANINNNCSNCMNASSFPPPMGPFLYSIALPASFPQLPQMTSSNYFVPTLPNIKLKEDFLELAKMMNNESRNNLDEDKFQKAKSIFHSVEMLSNQDK